MIVGALLGLFFCRAVLASLIVPPWQGPDEPVHFALVAQLVRPDGVLEEAQREVRGDVIRSMGRHRWWELYGLRTPPLEASSFDYQVTSSLGTGTYALPTYYGLGARVLAVTQPRDIEGAYVNLRVLSIVLGAGTLVAGWAGTRLLFGPAVAAGSTAVAALHPQFLLTSMAVNPDVLANLLGAVMWWQVARVVRRVRPAMSLLLVLVAGGAVLLTKRSAIPLALIAGCVALASSVRGDRWRLPGSARLRVLAAAAGVILLGVALLVAFPLSELSRPSIAALVTKRPVDEATWSAAFVHAQRTLDYFWLMAGWLRFPAPDSWVWVTRSLTLGGLAASAVVALLRPALRRPLLIAWLFVALQATIVVGMTFQAFAAPQGRYLFPVLAPAAALLWIGLTELVPRRLAPHSGLALIAIAGILDMTAFTTVLVPAYLPWG